MVGQITGAFFVEAGSVLINFAQPDLTGNELKYLTECIRTNYVTHAGRFEGDFEASFASKFGCPALATSSGTGALHLALLALGIGRGDEVIVPDLTFGATASVVMATGATPVLVDVDPATWCLDKNRTLAAIGEHTKAIMPVHLYGLDAGDFSEFGLPVIEDACEALGCVPIRGQMACYSFYGNKFITTGEGGMLCGDYGNAKLWRDGGFDEEYRTLVPGLNYRMSNMQAALGLAQLERFNDLLALRLSNARHYAENLKGRGKWLFVAEVSSPRIVREKLSERGIDSRPVFYPLHKSPAFRTIAPVLGYFEDSEQIWQHGIALPTGPHVTEQEQQQIVDIVNGSCDLC
jgi:perosamine synthetase